MMEVRSYRRVFDLERRIYAVDRLRLGPGGVPARVLVYVGAAVISFALFARLPLLGLIAGALPWYLWELALPCAAGVALGALRIDGRSFHLAALGAIRHLLSPSGLVALRRGHLHERRWHPPELVLLPDGSEGRMRRMLYRGPGALVVSRPCHLHERQRPSRLRHPLRRHTLTLSAATQAQPAEAEVIVLHEQVSVLVLAERVVRA
jgi:hypothetical protein